MKLLTTISIIAALGLSACNSTSVESTKSKSQVKVVENEAIPANEAIITDIYWKLIKLDGKDIEDAENPHDQPHFMLNTKENRVTGNDGCNGFFGNYILEVDNRIKFDQLGGTKRFCAETVVNDQEFMQVFAQANSYSIRNGFLELYVGRRAPLAVFKAVVDKPQ